MPKEKAVLRFKLHALTSNILISLGACVISGHSWAQTQAEPHAGAAPAPSLSASFSGKTIASSDSISIHFPSAVTAGDGQFAVLVGAEDLTANFRWVSPTQLDGVFAAVPLPSGTNILKVYQIADGNQWKEIAQFEISVAAPSGAGGAKVPVIKPALIVGIKSQLAQSHSLAATPPLRATYADLTTQASLQTEHGNESWTFKSQINLVGSSYQPEAIDYGNQLNDAPKLDIANYLLESSHTSQYGITSVALGHVQAGNHPLLASGIGNRGLSLSHKFGERGDIAAAFQNGNAIVGGLNLFGINDREHRLSTFTVGFEALDRPGGLRLEATSFSGIVKPKLTTGIATLQDAEESKGHGLRLKAQNEQASLRADIAYAQSTYTPKGDSTLNILPGPATKGSSWYVDLGFDALKNVALWPDYPLSLTLQAKHEQSSFGFRTLGAGVGADFQADSLGFNASLGVINGQLQLTRRADNVDNHPAFLKNRSTGYNFSLNAPLASLIDKNKPPIWAPSLSYSQSRSRNFSDTAFIPLGQTLANLSNVTAESQNIGASWAIHKLNLSYQLSNTQQDNQQIGFEAMDAKDVGHNITAAYAASEKLNLTGSLGKRTATDKSTGAQRFSNTAQVGVNWLFGDRYTLSSNLSTSRDRYSLLTSNSKVLQANLQLIKQFDAAAFGIKLPGQWMLGYTFSNTDSLGIVVRYQNVNAALSLAFF